MKYAIIGTGAIGGYYGGKLANAGFDVHFLLHSDYDYVRQHGIQVNSCNGDFHLDAPNIYNNVEERQLTPRLRANFVYVPQGNTLLSGTIRENLCLGKHNATDEEMREALIKSCAEFVFDLPDGLDTACAEKGGGLSEGQAQRICIARALLRNRSVMLFDEATSALDPDTERRLLKNILASHDKTIIFITHRLAVVDYCDDVLRVEKTS